MDSRLHEASEKLRMKVIELTGKDPREVKFTPTMRRLAMAEILILETGQDIPQVVFGEVFGVSQPMIHKDIKWVQKQIPDAVKTKLLRIVDQAVGRSARELTSKIKDPEKRIRAAKGVFDYGAERGLWLSHKNPETVINNQLNSIKNSKKLIMTWEADENPRSESEIEEIIQSATTSSVPLKKEQSVQLTQKDLELE